VRRAGIYLRMATDQDAETQLGELETVAARSEWEIVEVYRDAGVSGGKGRDKRPAFNRLIKDATTRKINMIAAWSVDCLGRSLQDLVALLTDLQALECDLYLHQQTLDTSTPAGRAVFQSMQSLRRIRAQHRPGTRSCRTTARQGERTRDVAPSRKAI
jgi:DNA invertase Pin-like site-specific DNA recombinase